MQACSKCGRTYQDDKQKFCTFDGGRLELASDSAPTVMDLNKTIQTPPPPGPGQTAPIAPPPVPDLNRTIAGGPPTPTSEFQTHATGPTHAPTSAPLQPPHSAPLPPAQPPSAPLPPAAAAAPAPSVAQPEKKSSKLPLILGIAGVLLLLGLGAGGVLVWFLTSRSEKSTPSTVVNTNTGDRGNTNTGGNGNTASANTSPSATATAPPNSNQFVSTRNNLNSLLAQHYMDFSFYYPRTWELDPKAGGEGSTNFVKVERRLPPDFTQENFAVGYYESNGTVEADRPIFTSLVKSLDSKFSASFPEYKKISQGETKINSIDGYEFHFQSVSRGTEKGDITIWGRVVFLPPGSDGDKRGLTLLMLATSIAPELKSIEDVGVRGELPMILNSFKLGQ